MNIITWTRPTLRIAGATLLLFLITFSACSRKASTTSNKTYFPSFLKGIKLGQEQAAVLKLRSSAYVVNSLVGTQWQQFTEDLTIDNFTSAYYDFEKTGERQLVSIALLHKSEDSAAATFKNFGGKVTDTNPNERHRSEDNDRQLYATKKGRRVTFYLPVALQKNTPSADQ